LQRIRSIFRPKTAADFDEEVRALQEFEERERELLADKVPEVAAAPAKRFFKPLPQAEYRSSRVAIEKEVATDDEPKVLPKKFMTATTTEAVVSFLKKKPGGIQSHDP
jgi:hypothetical protein